MYFENNNSMFEVYQLRTLCSRLEISKRADPSSRLAVICRRNYFWSAKRDRDLPLVCITRTMCAPVDDKVFSDRSQVK